jgi:hypothetical protein
MKIFLRFILLLGALFVFMSSGWVSYSDDRPCPELPAQTQQGIGEGEFLSAHGLTQENYSIWLKEHSVWRRKNADELRAFTFIPQDFDNNRR